MARKLQVVTWPHPRDWAVTIWHWPRERPKAWPTFGFWALCLGPVEFRFWPDWRESGQRRKAPE